MREEHSTAEFFFVFTGDFKIFQMTMKYKANDQVALLRSFTGFPTAELCPLAPCGPLHATTCKAATDGT